MGDKCYLLRIIVFLRFTKLSSTYNWRKTAYNEEQSILFHFEINFLLAAPA